MTFKSFCKEIIKGSSRRLLAVAGYVVCIVIAFIAVFYDIHTPSVVIAITTSIVGAPFLSMVFEKKETHHE